MSVGTGFFFKFRERGTSFVPCLVSNRHVVKDATSGSLRFHTADDRGAPDPKRNYEFRVEGFEGLWIPHPIPEVDLAIMPVGGMIEQMQKAAYEPFLISLAKDLIPTPEDLAAFTALEDIVMVGYPIGLWDTQSNLPVFRRGTTATHPRFDFNGRPEFLIDAACFPGSSGSPVFLFNVGSYASREGALVAGSRVKLLGVLHAGPVYTAEGELHVVDIPTRQEVVARSSIPTNLGLVLKSRLLLDFEVLIQAALPEGDA